MVTMNKQVGSSNKNYGRKKKHYIITHYKLHKYKLLKTQLHNTKDLL